MSRKSTPHPLIDSREQWIAERKKLLVDEKEQTKDYEPVNAQRRRLPMVTIEKEYVFTGPKGKPMLEDLFDGSRQLIVQRPVTSRLGPQDSGVPLEEF